MSIAAPPRSGSAHAELIARLGGDDCEPYLERGLALMSRGGDLPLLLALAAAMARCCMASPAMWLLQSAGHAVAADSRVRQMLERLIELPDGTIAPEEVAARFLHNAGLVLERYPSLEEFIRVQEPPTQAGAHGELRYIRSRGGNVHVFRANSSPRFSPVFPFVDAQKQWVAPEPSATLPPATLLSATCLIGVPNPALLDRLWSQAISSYRPPIDILESNAEALRAWLGMIENASMLSDERLSLHFGENPRDTYAQALQSNVERVLPTIVLTNHRAGWQPPVIDDLWRRSVAEQVRNKRRQQHDRCAQRLNGIDRAAWRTRFQDAMNGRRSLRLVGFTNRYSTVVQHAMRDLADAFKRIGHSFDVVAQTHDCNAAVDVGSTLTSRDYDGIVAINHLRFEYAGLIPANIPFIGWVQDHLDHLWTKEAGVSVGGLDLVIAHAPDVLVGLYGYPRERVLASSNLTDPHVYSIERLDESQLEPYRCDVSFVSHGSSTPEQLCQEIEYATSPSFGRFMREALMMVRARLTEWGCLNAQQLVELMLEAERSSGHTPLSPSIRRANVYPQVARIHDRVLRHQTLEWAASWALRSGKTLRIHGRGWDAHPTLSKFAAGEVSSGRALRALFQASAVSLQANAYSSLHQRLLDGVASGCLLLSRWNPADFVREPFIRIAQAIAERGLTSVPGLLAAARTDSRLAENIARAEQLSGAVIAPSTDARRQRQIAVLKQANDIAELQSDEGLFAMLRDMRFLPARVANDLPEFGRTVFATERELHDLLDRYVDDPSARSSIVEPMRAAIIEHDTFEGLARRIISKYAEVAP